MILVEPNKKQAKIRLMDLPVEILMEIYKRLPVKSVLSLRCVSKRLLDLVDSPLFVSLHSISQIATNAVAEESRLVFRHVLGKEIALQSLNYDAGKGKVNLSDIFSTYLKQGRNIHFVFHNFFCMEVITGPDKRCFLIDPLREEVLRLPTSDKLGEDRHIKAMFYGAGFDKKTITYKIVRLCRVIELGERSPVIAQVHVLGTSLWHEIPAPSFGPCVYYSYYMECICAYGDMHWMFKEVRTNQNHIISFDFTKQEFYSTPHPAALSTEAVRYITLKGSMAIVKIPQTTTIEIWVMKDYNTKEWTLEYNIDHLQTLGWDSQLKLRMAACHEWENGIFFILDESDTSLFYDLRYVPVNQVTCQIEGKVKWTSGGKILCFKRSLISLKEFGKVGPEPGLDFSRKHLWES